MTSPLRPVVGVKLVMLGGIKVKSCVEVTTRPPTDILTFPVWERARTRTLISVPSELTSCAPAAREDWKLVPPKETLLCDASTPKPVPVIVITSPLRPVVGVKLVMLGGIKVKSCVEVTIVPLEPPTRTLTFPVGQFLAQLL